MDKIVFSTVAVVVIFGFAAGIYMQDEQDIVVDSSDEQVYGMANVQSVEIHILESFPVQVRAVAEGYLSDGCEEIDKVTTEREGNEFVVKITTVSKPNEAQKCTLATVPFSETVELDVLGLSKGVYTVDVNGVVESFELSVDNVIPE